MKAWPYRQECRGHDPAKKESVVLMKLTLLARCAQTHCYGQCVVHQVLRWTQNKERQTRDNTQAVAGMNSHIRISAKIFSIADLYEFEKIKNRIELQSLQIKINSKTIKSAPRISVIIFAGMVDHRLARRQFFSQRPQTEP